MALWPALLAVPALGIAASAGDSFESVVQPLLAQNCYSCHNEKLKSGDLNLQVFTSSDAISQNREKWETILRLRWRPAKCRRRGFRVPTP